MQLCAEGTDFVRAGRVAAGALSDDSSLHLHLEELNLYVVRCSMRVDATWGEMSTPEAKDPTCVPQETVGEALRETREPPRYAPVKQADEARAEGRGTLAQEGYRV